MLEVVLGDRAHAFGDRLVLQMDVVNAAVDRVGALGLAIDAPVVACVGGEPPAAEPIGGVGEKFEIGSRTAERRVSTASCSAERSSRRSPTRAEAKSWRLGMPAAGSRYFPVRAE